MRTTSFNIEVLALLVLALIPWPGPTVFKISCPRDSARVVRKLVQKKWMPVLEKRSVQLGVECPFHPSRDMFGAQQAAKQQHRASQWTCAFCGKSFYTERHLDAHFDSRHRDTVNTAEDAVCLADYCDVMRCEVVAAREAGPGDDSRGGLGGGTDVEVWKQAAAQAHRAHRTALSVPPPRDLARVSAPFPPVKVSGSAHASRAHQKAPPSPPPAQSRCPQSAAPGPGPAPGAPRPRGDAGRSGSGGPAGASRDGDANATADMCASAEGDLVDSSVPPQQARLTEMQRLKANCKPEELQKLKTRCEILVRDCIAGLLVNLSIQDFKEVEEELNRASCWYLTCDRYWEDSPAEPRPFAWGLLGVVVVMLSLGVTICYYIIWVLFDSDDASVLGESGGPGSAGGAGGRSHRPQYYLGDDNNEHYIYVTYPPDLKRRLLERPPLQQQTQQQQQMPSLHHHHLHHHHPQMHYQPPQMPQHQIHQQMHMRQQMPSHMSHSPRSSPRHDMYEREWKI